MGTLNPDIVGAILGIPGGVLALFLFLRYKLKKKELEMGGSDPELGREVDALRDDLNETRAQLTEVQERLDFAERLLAEGRAGNQPR